MCRYIFDIALFTGLIPVYNHTFVYTFDNLKDLWVGSAAAQL